MPILTVITSTRNKGDYNIAATRSILQQTFADFRYILVNDGSTDDTRSILKEFDDPRLDIVHQENKGFTRTFCETLAEVTTPYVAIHGAGDISHPERLERQIAYLDANSSVGAVGCFVERTTADGRSRHVLQQHKPVIDTADDIIEANCFTHGEVVFRRAVYLQAGGYRPFFTYCQDYDLWFRMVEIARLAIIDCLLYRQVMIPENSISCCLSKTEEQLLFAAFARHLARRRLAGDQDPPATMLSEAFQKCRRSLCAEERRRIAWIMFATGRMNYRGTGSIAIWIEAAKTALKYWPAHKHARKLVVWSPLLLLARRLNSVKIERLIMRRYRRWLRAEDTRPNAGAPRIPKAK